MTFYCTDWSSLFIIGLFVNNLIDRKRKCKKGHHATGNKEVGLGTYHLGTLFWNHSLLN